MRGAKTELHAMLPKPLDVSTMNVDSTTSPSRNYGEQHRTKDFSNFSKIMGRKGGIYAVVMYLAIEQQITVAKHDTFKFPAGYYVYLGSAHGSGGLAARTNRHKRRKQDGKKFKWQIDYLREFASIKSTWFAYAGSEQEHTWAQAVSRIDGAAEGPMPKFGASDCKAGCGAHLFHFEKKPTREQFQSELSKGMPNFQPVHIESVGGSKASI